ncbi:hypothetical protein BS333_05700 [Vibrio azureus]|uniref:Uncharacterized protein n=1 Tax=Vibrio azureus NBRC 104587 TaxID=1219077 RepID=U3ALP1_9VIBR|nr:hypothetical protein BS333_05700 [Vibrio azureus]GAD74217.1 hypothetical protein VAZ01S_005_00170 [Vibrio azureus NBRC 104587]
MRSRFYLSAILSLTLSSLTLSPLSYSMCFNDGSVDTLTTDQQKFNKAEYFENNFNYSYYVSDFSSTLGELEHDAHQSVFKQAWPQSEQAMQNVPSVFNSSINSQGLLNRLGKVSAKTLEVLGPVADAAAVGIWLNNMVTTFSDESSNRLDKTAAVFSLLPLVGDEINRYSNDIKYFSAKEKIHEFETQSHYVYTHYYSDFARFHHEKQDAILLINTYDDYVKRAIELYLDHLLISADTEYRRLAAAFDRQLSRQMARMDLELLKVYGYISEEESVNLPLCHGERVSAESIRHCLVLNGPKRVETIQERLLSDDLNQLYVSIFQAKKQLVLVAFERMNKHRQKMIENIKQRAHEHIQQIYHQTSLNRSMLEERARMSGLREYAKANWDIDYLTEHQLNTAKFLVEPARSCFGVPSVYPGGILDSLESCKESGPLFDIYHIEKDPQLLNVITDKPIVDIDQYIERKIAQGWKGDLLKEQLTKLASDYAFGVKTNDLFNFYVKKLSIAELPSFQTSLTKYLDDKGIDSSVQINREDWYQLSRWYELLLTERPSGSVVDRVKQYEAFRSEVQPAFQSAIKLAFIRDLYYSMPFGSFYSAKDLRFYSPFLVNLFNKIINTKYKGTEEEKREIVINFILKKVQQVNTVSHLHDLLGDLAVYAQIAQHQQSEVNNHSGHVDDSFLFNSSLSLSHVAYLNENHAQFLEQQTQQLAQHSIWDNITNISTAFEGEDLDSAIDLLGYMVKNNDMNMLPHIDEILMHELEEWIELQLTLEELEGV